MTGNGTPVRHVLGKSKMILGLLEGIPTMLEGEVAMVIISTFFNKLRNEISLTVVLFVT